jgi:pimeloyl-ACP methyl ester carboxylesterase
VRACSTCCKPVFVFALALSVAACATVRTDLDRIAADNGLELTQVEGRGFSHAIAWREFPGNGGVVHVYIEGDGRPWLRGRRIARDPTPDELLMLELMTLDRNPAVYLGRPCYHGHSEDASCRRELWAGERYSRAIVDSMIAALERLLDEGRPLVLIGHSGGGTLAMLMAASMPRVSAVITLAGNLDPDAWTAWHGYSPLTGSLNPTRLPPLSPRIRQIHVAAGRDSNIPAALIETASAHQAGSEYLLFAQQSHACCWAPLWPGILSRLDD